MGDSGGDDGDDIRWLTYEELGKARGISTASATRLAFRRKWRRQGGNQGVVRVAVPVDEAKPHKDITHDIREDSTGDITHVVSVLETAVAVLHEQVEHARDRMTRAEERLQQISDAAEVARREADAAIAKAQREQRAAEAEAAELRHADRLRRAAGLVGRLRAAWRGE